MNTQCFGQHVPLLDHPASEQLRFWHMKCLLCTFALQMRSLHGYWQKCLTWRGTVTAPRIAVSCLCLCLYGDQRDNFSSHCSDGSYLLLLFLSMCVMCGCAHVPVCATQPTHCSVLPFIRLLVVSQLCVPAVLLLLPLCCLCHCFTVISFISNWAWKGRQKLLKKSNLLNIMLQPSLLAYIVVIVNLLCKWGFVFALVSSVSFQTSHRNPSSRPLGKVHPPWLQSHLEFIEVSNSKTSGTLKQSSLGLVLSGVRASSWIIMCFPKCVRVFKTAGARIRAGIWLFDWQSLCSGKVGQQGRVQ